MSEVFLSSCRLGILVLARSQRNTDISLLFKNACKNAADFNRRYRNGLNDLDDLTFKIDILYNKPSEDAFQFTREKKIIYSKSHSIRAM